MRLSAILTNEAKESNGMFIMTAVPDNKQPSASTQNRIEAEIAAQISAKEAIRQRSLNKN